MTCKLVVESFMKRERKKNDFSGELIDDDLADKSIHEK